MGGFGRTGDFQGSASVPAAVPHGPGPRDERLDLFGQGGWADEAHGSAWLALQADDVSQPEVLAQATTSEVLGIGRSWKALETWTFSRKLAVVRELIRRHPLNECREPGGLPSEWAPELHHEVAAALGISPVSAGKLVRLAWTLDTRLPGIGQALQENRLDPARARLIVDGTSVLEDERKLAMAERIILDGLPRCRTWSALERLVERAVISVDPDGAKRRRQKAEQEHARLRFWRESCGTCAIQGVGLPADEALAAMAHIEGRVREYQEAGLKRPIDILRVMAFADLINGVTVGQRAAWSQADATAPETQQPNEAQEPSVAQEPKEPREAEKSNSDIGPGPGAISLPGQVNLTVPAAALEWLAEWCSEHAGTPASDGPRPRCGNRDDASTAVRQDLVFPLFTLLGLAERPGEAHGLGTLDAALVRELTAAVARHPDSKFCLTVTDDHGHAIGHGCCKPQRGASRGDVTTRPDRATITHSGRAGPDGGFGSWILTVPGLPLPFVVDIDPVPTYDCDHRFESARHDPGAKLRHLVQVRDGTCSFPTCARHARESDFEHALAFHQGGRTCACNAHACSRSCHRAKQSRGWQVTKPRPGWTRWETKAGRTYLQGPWRYPS